MADNIKNGQTCLEERGIDCRNNELARNTYFREGNEYSVGHADAISDGDKRGKGTGGNTSKAWVPDCSKSKTLMDYSNFTTDRGGDIYDIEGRNGIGGRTRAMAASLFTQDKPYGANLINTSNNEGQVVINW